MHAAFFDVGVDAVETASFGSFSTVLNEYGVADQAYELNVAAARIAREVADDYGTDGRPRYVAGSIGPGTKLPSLGHIGFAELRDAYEEQASGLLDGGVDLFLIETCMDLLQVKAAMIGCRRAMAAAGRDVPLQVQVTMETTGRMLVGSEIGAALVSIAAMKPGRARHQLRHRSGRDAGAPALPQPALARCRSACCPTPACRASSTDAPTTTSRRSSWPSSTSATSPSSASTSSAAAAARRRSTCARSSRRVKDLTPATRTADLEPSVTSIYSPVPIEQEHQLPDHRRAHQRQRFEGVPRRDARPATGTAASKMANEQIREGAHVLDVCVDYVGRDGALDMDEIAKRFATQASVPLVLDSTEPHGAGGRRCSTSAGRADPQLGQPRGRRAAGQPPRPGVHAGPRVRRGGDLPAHRRARPGPRRRVEDGDRPPHPRDRHRALRPRRQRPDLRRADVPAVDRRRRPAPRRHATRWRRSGGSRPRSPAPTRRSACHNVSFGLNPPARHALNSVFLHECVQAGLDSAIVHAGKIVPLNRLPDEQREVCLDLIYDRRHRRPTTRCRSCSRCSPT